MAKVKVTNIIATMGNGGAEKVALNYLRKFNNDPDIDFKLIILNKDFRTVNNKIIKNEKLNAVYLQNDIINKLPLLSKIHTEKHIKKLVKHTLEKDKPDIVHIHITALLNETLDAIKECQIPIRFDTLHSNPTRYKGKLLELAKKAFNNDGFIPICLNKEQALLASKCYGFNNYEIAYNGVDFANIKKQIISKEKARKKLEIPNDAYIIIGVGRLDRVKRFDILINSFSEVLNVNNNAYLLIAGSGQELKNLKRLVKELKIEKNVKFLGNISNVVPLYCAADILCMSSETEASPLVLLEAQACNLRCVISDGVPSESIVTNKVKQMQKNSSFSDWANALLDQKYIGEKKAEIKQYDLDASIQQIKKIYLKYWKEYQNEK